jgi:hypothetical protein
MAAGAMSAGTDEDMEKPVAPAVQSSRENRAMSFDPKTEKIAPDPAKG